MTLVYITGASNSDDKALVHRNPPVGKTAIIVNTESDLTKEDHVIVVNELESYDMLVTTRDIEAVIWADEHHIVAINILGVVN